MYVDENALPVSFQGLSLIEISPRQKRFTKDVACQVRDFDFELIQCCSVDFNIAACA